MPRVRVTHETEYRYEKPVQLLGHRLMLRPRDSHDLRLLETALTVSPPARTTRWAHDVFGNSVCFLTFSPERFTERLRIVSTLDLRHYPTRADLPLDPRAETFPFSYTSTEVPDLARSIERHYADPERIVDEWHTASCPPTARRERWRCSPPSPRRSRPSSATKAAKPRAPTIP